MPFLKSKKRWKLGFGHLSSDFFLFFCTVFRTIHNNLQKLTKEVSGEGLCNWEQLENHSGPHISLLLVLKQVLEEMVEFPGPSNPFLLAGKKDTGSVRILNRSGSQRSSRHRRNILPLPESEQLLEEEGEEVGLDILGLALLDDSRVVVFALEIRNGLHISAQVVLEQSLW